MIFMPGGEPSFRPDLDQEVVQAAPTTAQFPETSRGQLPDLRAAGSELLSLLRTGALEPETARKLHTISLAMGRAAAVADNSAALQAALTAERDDHQATKQELAQTAGQLVVANELAEKDELTGLPTARVIYAHLDHIRDNSAPGERYIVLGVDVDSFGIGANLITGHAGGNIILQAMARKFKVRGNDRAARLPAQTTGEASSQEESAGLFARYGGDEFVLIAQAKTDAAETAKQTEEATSEPMHEDRRSSITVPPIEKQAEAIKDRLHETFDSIQEIAAQQNYVDETLKHLSRNLRGKLLVKLLPKMRLGLRVGYFIFDPNNPEHASLSNQELLDRADPKKTNGAATTDEYHPKNPAGLSFDLTTMKGTLPERISLRRLFHSLRKR